jgi:hypothetical protein
VNLKRDLRNIYNPMNFEHIFDQLPSSIRGHKVVMKLVDMLRTPKIWNDKDIVLYCGKGFTQWSPKRLGKPKGSFIGGSEEAAILMCKALQKQGWKVTVFGDPGADEGVYDGVRWLSYLKFNRYDNFNILIGWRMVQFFGRSYSAKQKYLWCEDIQDGYQYTKERVANIDKVFLLSDWHYEHDPILVANLPRNKVFFTTNGIDV